MSPGAGCWQVFGLASRPASPPDSYCPPLPGPEGPVRVVKVVLAYRCGAAPDFHRVPFCSENPSTSTGCNVLHRIVTSQQYIVVRWSNTTGNSGSEHRLVLLPEGDAAVEVHRGHGRDVVAKAVAQA